MLRLLDRYWDVWAFFVLPCALLATAALLGWMAPSAVFVALVLIVAALAIVSVGLTLVAVLQAYRLLSGRRRISETAVGQVRASYWTMVLCHVGKPEQVGALVEAAGHREAPPRSGSADPLLILESGVTGREVRSQIRSDQRFQPLSDAPSVFVFAAPPDVQLEIPDEPGRFLGRDVALILGGSAVAFAVLARFIPLAERARCSGPSDCSGRPLTYGDALYWVFSRVLGGDPDGLGVASPWSRSIGLLLTFYGVVVLVGIVERLIQQQIDENLASGPALVRAFNERQAQRARLERDSAGPDQPPRRKRGLRDWIRGRAKREPT